LQTNIACKILEEILERGVAMVVEIQISREHGAREDIARGTVGDREFMNEVRLEIHIGNEDIRTGR
jgi:hypothetical protein